ncbi:glucan 1,4-alpha-glucosidase [Spizellomyces sp. 'palustris']|nr:glucan 1,4-alpha-glucosidase [Spizellomyces sp. 'palustris']
MSVVERLYERASPESAESKRYEHLLWNYATFSRMNQLQKTRSGFGEPKFHVNGSPFNGDWGRPQNDGPALRASTLIRFANAYLDRGGSIEAVKRLLYDSRHPTQTVIKADLEFTCSAWRAKCFDLWEEVYGHHFYTRMVQYAALQSGVQFAKRMKDVGAADWYKLQSMTLKQILTTHWDPTSGYMQETLDQSGGLPDKILNLDTATILAALHTLDQTLPYRPFSQEILLTAQELVSRMAPLYPINGNSNATLAPAIGRYCEDTYDGYGRSEGNPWILTTTAIAETLYHTASHLLEDTTIPPSLKHSYLHLAQNVTDAADTFLNRVRRHTPTSGALSEQVNKNTGFMQGAPHLTWSYASIITAAWAREKALRKMMEWKDDRPVDVPAQHYDRVFQFPIFRVQV